MTDVLIKRELLELSYQAVHALAGMNIEGYTEQHCAELRAILAAPRQPEGDGKWAGYSERQRKWLEQYEHHTGFEPLIDDRLGFIQNAEANILWFEAWRTEAMNAIGTIPGSEFDLEVGE